MVERSSTASSASTTLRGSANSDTERMSVARISPLRSRMSGRVAATASCADRHAAEGGRSVKPRRASRPPISTNSAVKQTMASRTRLLPPSSERTAGRRRERRRGHGIIAPPPG